MVRDSRKIISFPGKGTDDLGLTIGMGCSKKPERRIEENKAAQAMDKT